MEKRSTILAPVGVLEEWAKKKPDLFKKRVYNLQGLDRMCNSGNSRTDNRRYSLCLGDSFPMMSTFKKLFSFRELILILAWKNVALRYKQAYMGVGWAVLKPLALVLIFTLVRSFVGIDSGNVPYPVLTFAALLPWILFQESTADATTSVVANANLIRKIYFPREIFPITSVVTKLIEFMISAVILAFLMYFYRMVPTWQILWVPFVVVYTILFSLTVAFTSSALNVYYRDVSAMIPVVLSLMMYASPVIYPLSLVHQKLIENQAAGDWSNLLYNAYLLNPLSGIIDMFQRVVLKGLPPDFSVLWPGLILTAVLLPLSYLLFKKAEAYFADVV